VLPRTRELETATSMVKPCTTASVQKSASRTELSEIIAAREKKNQSRFHRISLPSTRTRVQINQLEVSVAMGAHLHCSLFCLTNLQMCELHRVMADLVNSLHPAALRVTAACPAKDSRLPLAACPSDTLPPHRAWSDRKSHRLDRCNNRVG